jgi:hypothetical protein
MILFCICHPDPVLPTARPSSPHMLPPAPDRIEGEEARNQVIPGRTRRMAAWQDASPAPAAAAASLSATNRIEGEEARNRLQAYSLALGLLVVTDGGLCGH